MATNNDRPGNKRIPAVSSNKQVNIKSVPVCNFKTKEDSDLMLNEFLGNVDWIVWTVWTFNIPQVDTE